MMKRIATVLIVVAVAGVYAWWSGMLEQFGVAGPAQMQNAEEAANQAAGGQAQTSDLPTEVTDTSFSAIEQDTAALDIQLQALQSDSASVDSSLDDAAVPQEY